MKTVLFVLLWMSAASVTQAGDYFRETWFDYPDPSTAPKVTARCVQEGSMDVPCPTWSEPLRMCRASGCTGHAYSTELLRVSPTFVVSGPDTPDEAAKRAVQGVVAVCSTQGVIAAKAAGAAAPTVDPVSRVGAGLAAGVVAFKGCISSANAAALIAGIVNQLEFKIESPTHWSPL